MAVVADPACRRPILSRAVNILEYPFSETAHSRGPERVGTPEGRRVVAEIRLSRSYILLGQDEAQKKTLATSLGRSRPAASLGCSGLWGFSSRG